jgi:hypothetical protein
MMNQAEWLTCADPAQMLAYATRCPVSDAVPFAWPPSARKLRLFACACCRLVGVVDGEPIAECEAWADGGEPVKDSLRVCADPNAHTAAVVAAQERFGARFGDTPALQPAKAALLREIVGNPFRPVALPYVGARGRVNYRPGDPVRLDADAACPWLTPTVLALTGRIYEEHDFGLMPVLADALEDAGCTDASILNHLCGKRRCVGCLRKLFPYCVCGGTGWLPSDKHPVIGPHVRGCWAIDCILGKE